MTLAGTVVNGVVVLENGQSLPDGTRVTVTVQAPSSGDQPQFTLAERLLKLAGTVNDLPSDMAKNHDHYLHGQPKR